MSMSRKMILKSIEMVKSATVQLTSKPYDGRLTWCYRLEGAPVELSGWSEFSYPSQSEAMDFGQRTRQAYIDAMQYSLRPY